MPRSTSAATRVNKPVINSTGVANSIETVTADPVKSLLPVTMTTSCASRIIVLDFDS